MDNLLQKYDFPLILVGMGRSGTSLLASWLQKSGINIGDNLMGASVGNVNGHFEDIEIVTLHDSWLKKRGLSWCSTVESISLTKEEIEQGNAVITKLAKNNHVWGWKDPRTCLFLDIWDNIIQNAHYLIVFREPDEVVSSLLRRDKEWCHKGNHDFVRKLLCIPRFLINKIATKYQYYRTWRTYNKCILEFLEKDGVIDRALVFSINNYINSSVEIISYLQCNWGYPLDSADINEVYESDKFKSDKVICNYHVKKLNDAVMEKLKNYERMSLNKLKLIEKY